MKVRATLTSYEDVEVSESEVIKCALKLFDKKYKLKGDYINDQGYWMVFDYCHPHNGDINYKKGEIALPEDKMLLDFRHLIETLNSK